ncbi:MAG: GNAT family N-acetyltransferase [Acetatifactor sp.]|nr:GNAT family N-acetyltransferase [Acetatifactor sp.]
MEITFRLGTMEDLDEIFQIFQRAIKRMDEHNIPQWDDIYPDKETFRQDIIKQELHVGVIASDEIVSVYVVNQECDPQYQMGSWSCPFTSCRIIHRLCVNPAFQNRGVGRQTMEHLERELYSQGVRSIRLDAFMQNPYSLRMYYSLSYRIVGYTQWRKGRFCLLEKKL